MKTSHATEPAVTVEAFLENGAKELHLELIGGKAGLSRRILEGALNRPGLALAGFFEHFAHRRIQVFGLAECAYLATLGEDDRKMRLRDLFSKRIPCAVVTRGRKTPPELEVLAEECGVAVLRTSMITMHFVNAATIIMENLMAPRVKVQGTMVEIMGIGVLIEGKSGLGKSEVALALIKKGHALVADDVTALRIDSAGSVLASAVDVTRYHMEIRGLGIIHVPSLFGVASVRGEKKLDLVVSLREPGVDYEDRTPGGDAEWEVLGVKVPRVTIPVGAGRDLANVVETAALNQKLRTLGHDAEKEFDERLIAMMTRGKDGSD